MRRLIPLVLALGLALPAAPADASTTALSRARAALASIGYDYAALGYTLTFKGARTGLLGATYTDGKRIEIYVRPTESSAQLRRVIAYEIGHAVDLTWSTASSRKAWLKARGAKASTPWLACDLCNEDQVGAGDFADVFAEWATGTTLWSSKVAARPSAAKARALARTFFHVGQTPPEEVAVPTRDDGWWPYQ